MAEDRGLAPLDVVEGALDALQFGLLFLSRAVVNCRKIGFEERTALGTEHAICEEGRYGLHERILADVDHLGMSGVPVGPSSVVTAR
ncbi:hypothetical protein ACFOWZ_42375 [Lentzea rhizosphaerae]|uniref:Uncharacterized protein n=1 Tax=Lentzea rhizosphaerae TaxID=2041025 RepID=A0ABV8C867_9PSEU